MQSSTNPERRPKDSPQGRISLLVDINRHTLTLLAEGRPFKTYPVCVGKRSTPTPVGEWRIVHKSLSWGGGFGTRWLGLNVPWGTYGIHGTNRPQSIGRAESHGCVRMFNRDVEELYPWVPLGTPVKITGEPALPPGWSARRLKAGMVGPDVVQVQLALKSLGLYWSYADGRYGPQTARAAAYWQHLRGLEANGELAPESQRQLQADAKSASSGVRISA
ncbi:MAG: L,D-transpeptidase family protein [Moorellales bacterium]